MTPDTSQIYSFVTVKSSIAGVVNQSFFPFVYFLITGLLLNGFGIAERKSTLCTNQNEHEDGKQ